MHTLEIDEAGPSTGQVISTEGGAEAWTRLRSVGIGGLAAAVYFIVAKLSLSLAFEQPNTAAVWPVSGLAIASLVVFGLRWWPAVTVGVFILTLTIEPFSIGKH